MLPWIRVKGGVNTALDKGKDGARPVASDLSLAAAGLSAGLCVWVA